MKTVQINLKITDELLKQLDKAAEAAYTSRSDYIRECIVLRLKDMKVIQKERDEFMERLRRISGEID